jgi:hypothetical protein
MILLGQLLLDASRAGVENLEAAILRYCGESLERGLKAREGLVECSCHPFSMRITSNRQKMGWGFDSTIGGLQIRNSMEGGVCLRTYQL